MAPGSPGPREEVRPLTESPASGPLASPGRGSRGAPSDERNQRGSRRAAGRGARRGRGRPAPPARAGPGGARRPGRARGVDDRAFAGAAVGPAGQPVAGECPEPLRPLGSAAQVAGSAAPHAQVPAAFFRHQVQLDTRGLPTGTLHVQGGVAEPQVAVSTCRTQELAQGARGRQRRRKRGLRAAALAAGGVDPEAKADAVGQGRDGVVKFAVLGGHAGTISPGDRVTFP